MCGLIVTDERLVEYGFGDLRCSASSTWAHSALTSHVAEQYLIVGDESDSRSIRSRECGGAHRVMVQSGSSVKASTCEGRTVLKSR